MMENGHENPRLIVSSLFKSWMKIITNPVMNNIKLIWFFVALSMDILPDLRYATHRKKDLGGYHTAFAGAGIIREICPEHR
jgi:hypothetical protein